MSCRLFNQQSLVDDYVEYLIEDKSFQKNTSEYTEYIDMFVEGIWYEDLEYKYICVDNIDILKLFIYIRENEIDILDYITEYMKNDENNHNDIREKIIKLSVYVYLRNNEEVILDIYSHILKKKLMKKLKFEEE
tara:strand:+ start:180 stop:581 length:402 start_codon:yes stop_codon:yes gene_type:complete